MAEVERQARLENLPAFVDAIRLACDEVGAHTQVRDDLQLIVEEACVNVMHHAYPAGQPGPLTMAIYRQSAPLKEALVVRLRDHGKPFDPVAAPMPDLEEAAETRPIGGLGTMLIRQMSDELHYERQHGDGERNSQGINCLTVVKHLDGAGQAKQ